jgi:hypothetical protein
MQVVHFSPSNCPWTRPATRREGEWIQIVFGLNADDECGVAPYFCPIMVGARSSRVAPGRGDPLMR